MNGAVVIDKPQGMSSAAVVRQLKRQFSIAKIGHAGTLDPMATGVLVVLLGKGTRLQSLFLEAEKCYEGYIQLGVATATDDLEGAVLERDEAILERIAKDAEQLQQAVFEHFSGTQEQVPPQFSAVKVQGAASYKRARKGQQVALSPRTVNICFEDLQFEADGLLRYRVRCSKGTYIRSLARDIGKFLGSCGALSAIRRLESSPFTIEQAITLEDMKELESVILPMEELVSGLPRFELSEADCRALRFGDQSPLLQVTGQQAEAELAALFSKDESFCGVLERESLQAVWQIRFMM